MIGKNWEIGRIERLRDERLEIGEIEGIERLGDLRDWGD